MNQKGLGSREHATAAGRKRRDSKGHRGLPPITPPSCHLDSIITRPGLVTGKSRACEQKRLCLLKYQSRGSLQKEMLLIPLLENLESF